MMKQFAVIFIIVVGLISCNPKQESQTKHKVESYEPYSAGPTNSDISNSGNSQQGEFKLTPMTDNYGDGYEDGQAAAEEDRIARRPGMQSGGDDDDDDDDYEEGYDDGYEDM